MLPFVLLTYPQHGLAYRRRFSRANSNNESWNDHMWHRVIKTKTNQNDNNKTTHTQKIAIWNNHPLHLEVVVGNGPWTVLVDAAGRVARVPRLSRASSVR